MKIMRYEIASRLMTGNDNRLASAKKNDLPVILIFGRATQLKGMTAKLFFKAQQMSGMNREQAKAHSYAAVAKYAEKLNRAINRAL